LSEDNRAEQQEGSRIMKSIIATLAVGAALTFTGQASALTLSGDVNMIFPPADVTADARTNNNKALIFREQADTALAGDLAVQAYMPGTYDNGSSPVGRTLNAGRVVTSYFLHADVDDDAVTPNRMSGSITFSERILGVIFGGDFTPSDAMVGLAGTTYETAPGHGLDMSASGDSFRISNNRMRLDFDFLVNGITDQIRIITAGNAAVTEQDNPIPEPVTPALLAMGLGGLAMRRRRTA
jgi:hypothetical protein